MKRWTAIAVLICLSVTLIHSAVKAKTSADVNVQSALAVNLIQADSAYGILDELATKKRNERYFRATVSALAGLGTGALLGFTLGQVNEDAAFYGFIIPTAVGLAVAGVQLLFPTEAERELSAVKDLSESEREAASAEALRSLSEKAFVQRMVKVGVLAASALVSLLLPDENDSVANRASGFVSSVAGAIYTFLVPSDEERAYQRYLRLVD